MEGNAKVIDCHEPYCPIVPACSLQRALNEAHQAFYKSLKRAAQRRVQPLDWLRSRFGFIEQPDQQNVRAGLLGRA